MARLPSGAPALELAVLRNCAGVYQYTGSAWEPVELGAGGGARRLAVVFPHADRGRRQPLLVTGGATPRDVVAVTWEGGDLYHFSYEYAQPFAGYHPTWVTGPTVVVGPDRPHAVQIDLDSRLHQVFITVDGSPVLSQLYPVVPPTATRLGRAPSTATTPTFAGVIRSVPVPTPVCKELERSRPAKSRGK